MQDSPIVSLWLFPLMRIVELIILVPLLILMSLLFPMMSNLTPFRNAPVYFIMLLFPCIFLLFGPIAV